MVTRLRCLTCGVTLQRRASVPNIARDRPATDAPLTAILIPLEDESTASEMAATEREGPTSELAHAPKALDDPKHAIIELTEQATPSKITTPLEKIAPVECCPVCGGVIPLPPGFAGLATPVQIPRRSVAAPSTALALGLIGLGLTTFSSMCLVSCLQIPWELIGLPLGVAATILAYRQPVGTPDEILATEISGVVPEPTDLRERQADRRMAIILGATTSVLAGVFLTVRISFLARLFL